jgi:hypothetical protein
LIAPRKKSFRHDYKKIVDAPPPRVQRRLLAFRPVAIFLAITSLSSIQRHFDRTIPRLGGDIDV